jgi:hypothetical protein
MGAPQMGGGPPGLGDDPQLHQALNQALEQNPGLREAVTNDPNMAAYILQAVQAGPGGGLPPLPQDDDDEPEMGPPQGGPQQQGQPGFFKGMGQYFQSPEGKDSMMMGLIMSRIGTDPQGALQMAQQFRQQRDQRAFQAQQGQLQRDQQRELVKLRSQGDKEQKRVGDIGKRWAKAQSQAVSVGLNTNDYDLYGDEQDLVRLEHDVTARSEQRKATETATKEKDKVQGYKEKILGRALKSPTEASIYTDPESPQYDAEFGRNLANANQLRGQVSAEKVAREKQMTELRGAQTDAARELARLRAGAKTDEEKESLKGLEKELDLAVKQWQDSINQAQSVELFAGNDASGKPMWGQAQEIFRANSALSDTHLKSAYDVINQIKSRTGGKSVSPKTMTPSAPPGAASDKAKKGFAFAYSRAQDESTKQSIINQWKQQFTDEPPIPQAP